jgi:predicted Zn-dependent protease
VEARDYQRAATVMEEHALLRPDDHSLWYQIAEVQGQAGNISKVHQARAEYFKLIGDYRNARDQLQFALRIEAENGVTPATESRLRQKIRNIEALERESRN